MSSSTANTSATEASMPSPNINDRPSLERIKSVEARTHFSRATIYRKISQGTFPRPINVGGRSIRFLSSDIDQFINARVQASRESSPL